MNTSAAEAHARGGLFRVRQILDNVEARPVVNITGEPAAINPQPSKGYYFWLMAPAIVLLAFISIYPFIWMIYMSLHDVEIGPYSAGSSVGRLDKGAAGAPAFIAAEVGTVAAALRSWPTTSIAAVNR